MDVGGCAVRIRIVINDHIRRSELLRKKSQRCWVEETIAGNGEEWEEPPAGGNC
jgi:hypothetical protein